MSIKPIHAGEPISAAQWIEPITRAVNEQQKGVAVGARTPANAGAAEGSATVTSGRLVLEQTNTITVTRDADGEVVTVAKPPALRGNIGTRIGVNGTEEIFPAYFPNNVILFVSVVDTGITGELLADLNWESRRWTIEV